VDRQSDSQMVKDFNERIDYQRKEKNKLNNKIELVNKENSKLDEEKSTLNVELIEYKKKNEKLSS